MIKLNLTANGKPQELILAYLQENASQTLADKINNGVPIEKDGKRLISKKDLNGFMSFATGEAKKLAEKSANSACVEDNVVYGWAIHYFEEDSIESKLYNEDGTEYKPVVKTKKQTPANVKSLPQKPQPQQANLFDMLNIMPTVEEDDDDSEKLNSDYTPEELQKLAEDAEENDDKLEETTAKPQDMSGAIKISPIFEHYLAIQKQYSDNVLFLRLGDFYEAFGKNAIAVAEPLNLTITSRDFGLDERVPMVGVPYHAFDNYLTKLIKTGYKVAVAEDIDDVMVFPQYDDEEEPEELTEAQMREFDSYVDEEPEELPTVSKIVGPSENDQDDEDCTEILNTESAKAFDREALCIISELFDGEITLA